MQVYAASYMAIFQPSQCCYAGVSEESVSDFLFLRHVVFPSRE
jgi:hypothetical protein